MKQGSMHVGGRVFIYENTVYVLVCMGGGETIAGMKKILNHTKMSMTISLLFISALIMPPHFEALGCLRALSSQFDPSKLNWR